MATEEISKFFGGFMTPWIKWMKMMTFIYKPKIFRLLVSEKF